MAACRGCGEQPGTGNYCTNCGLPLGEASAQPELIGTPDDLSSSSVATRSPRWRPLAAVLAIALVVGAVVLSRVAPSSPEVDEIGGDDPERTPNRIDVDRSLEWLVVATDQEGLIRVDPATGDVTDLGIEARSLGRAWGHVVVQDIEGKVYALNPGLLTQQPPIELPPPINDVLYAFLPSWINTSSTPDHVWISPGTGGATEVSLLDGSVARSADVQRRQMIDPTRSPSFASPASGGVYQLEADGTYELVTDGSLLAEGRETLLIQRCGQDFQCSNQWVDAKDLSDVSGLFTPRYRDESMRVAQVADGQFLVTEFTDRIGGSEGSAIRLDYSEVRDVNTGTRVEMHSVELDALWDGRADIAPDGSLVAVSRNLDLYVRATGSRSAVRMETDTMLTGTTPVFIAKPAPEG
ncbi:MAG: hypothetical protein ACN4GZ_10555 [Acidimicrobiales bacterium]